ncbi:hypothetical protein GQ600_2024 [Phytophthora cactorum]|nr:hypothetical protein GQ600_2024 [Phytophthora cactorum]
MHRTQTEYKQVNFAYLYFVVIFATSIILLQGGVDILVPQGLPDAFDVGIKAHAVDDPAIVRDVGDDRAVQVSTFVQRTQTVRVVLVLDSVLHIHDRELLELGFNLVDRVHGSECCHGATTPSFGLAKKWADLRRIMVQVVQVRQVLVVRDEIVVGRLAVHVHERVLGLQCLVRVQLGHVVLELAAPVGSGVLREVEDVGCQQLGTEHVHHDVERYDVLRLRAVEHAPDSRASALCGRPCSPPRTGDAAAL